MIKIEIVNVDSNIDQKEVRKLIGMFDYSIEKPIYIELWEENKFRTFFKMGNVKLKDPLTGKEHLLNGWYEKPTEKHEFAIVINKSWKKTLFHELMHCHQSETVGVLWDMLSDIYEHKRMEDPFELQAAYYAENKIKKEKLK